MEPFSKLVFGVLMVVAVAGLVAVVLGWPTMLLWNSTVPEVFGLSALTFWQAVRLNVLCALLFKSSGSSSSSSSK